MDDVVVAPSPVRMFELNIVSVPPKPKQSPKPRPPSTTEQPPVAVSAPPAPVLPAAPPLSVAPKKPKQPRREKAPPAPPDDGAPHAPPAASSSAVKRGRYAKSSSATPSAPAHVPKEDPARAAALPATLPLGGGGGARGGRSGGGSSTFSAGSFDELPLDPYLRRHLTGRMAMSQLTPVQRHAIPPLLGGSDLLVRSPTGSGKTLAYAVPLVQGLLALGPSVVRRSAGTFAVVLVPTRELCTQTHEVLSQLATPFPWLVTSAVMGGEKRKAEKARLRKGVALLVGTPGRLSDHVQATRAWVVSSCSWLVLDEVRDTHIREHIGGIRTHATHTVLVARARRGVGHMSE